MVPILFHPFILLSLSIVLLYCVRRNFMAMLFSEANSAGLCTIEGWVFRYFAIVGMIDFFHCKNIY